MHFFTKGCLDEKKCVKNVTKYSLPFKPWIESREQMENSIVCFLCHLSPSEWSPVLQFYLIKLHDGKIGTTGELLFLKLMILKAYNKYQNIDCSCNENWAIQRSPFTQQNIKCL